jgi:hypothetical protein
MIDPASAGALEEDAAGDDAPADPLDLLLLDDEQPVRATADAADSERTILAKLIGAPR